jgi:hypothetical protein
MLIVKELDVSTWNADSLALMLWWQELDKYCQRKFWTGYHQKPLTGEKYGHDLFLSLYFCSLLLCFTWNFTVHWVLLELVFWTFSSQNFDSTVHTLGLSLEDRICILECSN